MSILENIANMLYLNDDTTHIFDSDELQIIYDKFYDKFISCDNAGTEFDNCLDLCELIDIIRNTAFTAGFKTSTKLWIEVIKDNN